ncbi:MAG TPA: hypothetical protein VE258_06380 [Ktedonobacterales bacterium]|nr:hypothetical protein [Ktedonobacterales bacterium]
MLREALRGAAAGAVGTVALDITTYADMMIRGRPSSNVPAQVAEKLTQAVGVDLAADAGDTGGQSKDGAAAQAQEQQRLSGLGALMGYATGLTVGALYGLTRPAIGKLPLPLARLALGAVAMVGSDVPAVATGATDPKTWGTSGWLADIVPHAIYGLVTVAAYELFDDE